MTADESLDVAGLRRAYAAEADVAVSDPITSWPKGIETTVMLNLA